MLKLLTVIAWWVYKQKKEPLEKATLAVGVDGFEPPTLCL